MRRISWQQRPKPLGTLRVRPGDKDKSRSSATVARPLMQGRFSLPHAQAIARAFGRRELSWRRENLAEVFAGFVEAGLAESLASQVIDNVPLEPIEPYPTLVAQLRSLRWEIDLNPPLAKPLRFGVPELPDVSALAQFLNLTPSELDWFADCGGWLRTASGPLSHYRYRQLPRRSGRRLVEAPKPRLREIQRTINRRILACLPVHSACHGFESGRNPATFSAPHSSAGLLIRMDLKNYFSSIGEPRVRAIFEAMGYSEVVSRSLAGLSTNASSIAALRGLDHEQRTFLRVPHLPQGAPTSPKLGNLAARGLDRRLSGFALRVGMTYTRYADDLAFSGADGINAGSIVSAVERIIAAEGLFVNRQKTLIRRSHQRQILAGLVVNDHPQVPRDSYDKVRAILHNAARTGAAAQNRGGHADFRAHVLGLISWIGETNPDRRERLLDLAAEVDWTT
ncbi:reverse transcriptase family protein [Smaragdicoccus niigatensis]|uniref:reverse transcriptase family protein n=1 Tax=Smaragdicoccus niigatensis TaxID=359359 RepID=UPI00037FE2C6|nr:reverse transcriptase family protein [Smaragdicoccus niigatensis]